MSTTRQHATLDLSRFRFICRAWHENFLRGQASERTRAINEQADWRSGDWEREKVWKIEGVEQ